MGIPRPPPFYSGNWTPSALSAGVNFGSMPATILSPSTNLSSVGSTVGKFLLQTLSEQVRQVYESLQLISLGAGPSVASRIASSSLFFLSFGHDDYAGIFAGGVFAAAGQPKYGRHGIARLLVSEMVRAIKDLYNAGVRRIAVAGVGPLGCSPRLRWEVASHASQAQHCLEEANDVVADYNSRLADAIREVGPALSGVRIVFCDVYKGTMKIISNHKIYGFNNTRDACCGAGLFGGLIGCWAKSMACNDPSAHIWWDMYRTTEAVVARLADWSWSPADEGDHICTPVSLKQLLS
ncbi:hypothetical protein HPP92_020858 [Vanilla planifolia]|uniref:GDSL esterase/lipase n=1 Tax=Vanilla planifolia TaxID=51239 RepID=A0A835PY23_VANPL|nr:hypothetical protein HPP92_020858 [Vanilla planifolia]